MSHPVIEVDNCVACGMCVETCPVEVLDIEDGHAEPVNADQCVGCGACMATCPVGAITDIAED